jgi:hypothetical protein
MRQSRWIVVVDRGGVVPTTRWWTKEFEKNEISETMKGRRSTYSSPMQSIIAKGNEVRVIGALCCLCRHGAQSSHCGRSETGHALPGRSEGKHSALDTNVAMLRA